MRAIAGHDGHPGVQQVIGLNMEAAVVGGQHLEGLGARAILRAAMVSEQHKGRDATKGKTGSCFPSESNSFSPSSVAAVWW